MRSGPNSISSGGVSACRRIQNVASPADAAPLTSQAFADTNPSSPMATPRRSAPRAYSLRAHLVDADLVGADDGVEQVIEAGVRGGGLEHPRFTVGQDGQRQPPCPQRLQPRARVIERLQPQVFVHEGVAAARIEVESKRLGRIGESVGSQRPEAPIAAHQAAQQGVLKLLGSPQLGQRLAAAGEQALAPRRHREHVEERAVGVERQSLDAGHSGIGGGALHVPPVLAADVVQRVGDLPERIVLHRVRSGSRTMFVALARRLLQAARGCRPRGASPWCAPRIRRRAAERFDVGDLLPLLLVGRADQLDGGRRVRRRCSRQEGVDADERQLPSCFLCS